ncbi:MAG: radical SAM protein [Bacteroidota bacterium]
MATTDILLITPPFTQLNTPYPASVFLKGFLTEHGFEARQLDLGIETLLHLLTKQELSKLIDFAKKKNTKLSSDSTRFIQLKNQYISCIEPVISFLQGKDQSIAYNICKGMLPKGKRFDDIPDLESSFGKLGIIDRAKFLCTLFLEDISDFINECIDPNFGFSRYAEKISSNAASFEDIIEAVESPSLITEAMLPILENKIVEYNPLTIGISIPFPGNFVSGLKIANYIKQKHPKIKIIIGGGFVNTELREISEIKLFNYVDFVCIDDGERPLIQLLNHFKNRESADNLVRTYFIENKIIKYIDNKAFPDFEHSEIGTPDYSDLPLDKYISSLEMANPMHRLWNDGRWNKLQIAHGCYWHKCSFCDVSLDYISRFSKTSANVLCNRIEAIIKQTGQSGFHFVDEAAPPAVLKELAIEILKRKLQITWWTNIRFENAFSSDLCLLLAESGCIAVSGGLEVASDRLLELMQKGVSIEQVAKVTSNFEKAGIMIHAYLIYGFPTQTVQETIDALEVVRQFFLNGLIHSAYWHRFAMTIHSPIGKNPEEYGIKAIPLPKNCFAKNEQYFQDNTPCNHDQYSFGLKKALYNYMHNQCLDYKLNEWFDIDIPKTKVLPTLISDYLFEKSKEKPNPNSQIIWIGSNPLLANGEKGKMNLIFDSKKEHFEIELNKAEAKWLEVLLKNASLTSNKKVLFNEIEVSYTKASGNNIKNLVSTRHWKQLRKNGLLIL